MRLGFVAESIHDLRCDESSISALGQHRNAITLARGSIPRYQRTASEIRKYPTSRGSSLSRQLLSSLQHVFINIQCSSHLYSITHQTSDVNTPFRLSGIVRKAFKPSDNICCEEFGSPHWSFLSRRIPSDESQFRSEHLN